MKKLNFKDDYLFEDINAKSTSFFAKNEVNYFSQELNQMNHQN